MCITNQPLSDPSRIEEAKLNSRGWVLQERLLSRRIVHFAMDQLYWECRCHVAAEDGLLKPNMQPRQDQLMGVTRALTQQPSTETFVKFWLDIIERYSQLKFTFEKDRLPALLGLKEQLASLTDLHYVDGHWFPSPGNAIPRSLLFYVDGVQGVHCAEKQHPSWSWVGKGSAVTYEATISLPTATYISMEDRIILIRGHIFPAWLDPKQESEANRIHGVYCDIDAPKMEHAKIHRRREMNRGPPGQIKFDSVTHMPSAFQCLWVFTHASGSSLGEI
jgi:hypothetical protein